MIKPITYETGESILITHFINIIILCLSLSRLNFLNRSKIQIYMCILYNIIYI